MTNAYLRRALLEQSQRRTALVDEPADKYSEHTVQELKDAVASRNEGREDADLIQVPAPGNKPQLIAALTADDRAQADAEHITEGA